MRTMLVVIATFFCGCATHPVSTDKARPVPQHRLLVRNWVTPPKSGVVVLKRDGGDMGKACLMRVFVDSVAVADLGPNEKVTLPVAPGNHIFGVQGRKLCGGGLSQVGGVVVAGEQLVFRASAGALVGAVAIQPTGD